MKKLTLLRHAKSSWRIDENQKICVDHDRPLNERGRIASSKLADYFNKKKFVFDFVLCSSAKRALQTANYIHESLKNTKIKFDPALYTFDYWNLMTEIRKTEMHISNLLVIGHNPAIEELSKYIANPDINSIEMKRLSVKFPTASLSSFELTVDDWAQLSKNCGDLTKFTTPKDINTSG